MAWNGEVDILTDGIFAAKVEPGQPIKSVRRRSLDVVTNAQVQR